MRIARFFWVVSLLWGGYAVASYAADGAVKVTSIAEVEEIVVGKDGKKTVKRTAPTKAVPGTEVIFTNVFENVSNKVASDIVINNPVPQHTTYKAQSATGKDTAITFSVDGGKTFASSEKLFVKGENGKPRVALPSEYTHIRWIYKGQLAPGKSSAVSFRALIQ